MFLNYFLISNSWLYEVNLSDDLIVGEADVAMYRNALELHGCMSSTPI
jgi:hypothetical protein